MKNFNALAFAMFLSASLIAQDYYWVGDGGNWSDLTHWATTSGGNTFHTELPGPENDVYFDANSFTTTGQTVTLDLSETYCRNFTAVNVQHNPNIVGLNFYDRIHIHGDLNMSSAMGRTFRMIMMESETEAQITTGELNLGGFLQLVGGGVFHQNDSISAGNVYVYGSELNTNNHPIHTTQRIYGNQANTTINLGTSNLYTRLWWMIPSTNLDASNATIYFGGMNNVFGDFYGAGHYYNHVVITGEAELKDNNFFGTFEAIPGADITLTAGSVQTADQFVLHGSPVEAASIRSTEVGTQATLSQASGEVNASYLVLQDNNATGGATFNADESIDQGNNTGWNITITVPMDYYWVGGPGSWDDMSHWATTSGGNTFHTSPPSAVDDVYFDENSGLSSGNNVNLGTTNRSCRNFTITNVAEDAVINQPGTGNLSVYGNFISDSDVFISLGNVSLLSESDVTLSIATGSLGNNCALTINTQGNVQLLTPLNVRNLTFLSGSFLANGNDISVLFQFLFQSTSTAFADLSDLTLNVRLFSNNSPPGQLVVSNTEIFSSGTFGSNNQDYFRVTLEGAMGSPTQNVNGSFSAEELIILPGAIVETQAGSTITTGSLIVEGTADEPIEIFSSQDGTESTFSQASGTVTGNHLILKDNHATGGALFIANSSQELSNVVGWNVVTSTDEIAITEIPAVFPNPATDVVNVWGFQGETLHIFSMTGALVQSVALMEGTNNIGVDGLSPGMYILDIASDVQRRSERLVVR